MNLDRVTITGIDDSTDPKALIDLTLEFPFVEWGILFSKQHQGKPRWASYDWINNFLKVKGDMEIKLSAHLCGKWVKEFVTSGVNSFAVENPIIWDTVQRVQLNFHATRFHPIANFGDVIANDGKSYIFQYDGVNALLDFVKSKTKAYPLFDISGGNGILPTSWPKPEREYTGYAGGLSPDNIQEQLEKIKSVTGDSRIWIDMETRVRSDDDRILDLNKVRKCLEISSKYIKYA